MTVRFDTVAVGDSRVFFREAGPADAPVLLLLHGFPSSSHMFRDLMPLLADRFRVIAPDLPGFGRTEVAPGFGFSFDALADVVEGFTDALGLRRYALYVFDYGAPTGFRLAVRHPGRVSAIVTQNGNAYLDGFGEGWDDWRRYWQDPTPANRERCRAALGTEAIRWQYETGAPAGRVGPDGWTLDEHYLTRPGRADAQLDLILSYRGNLERYGDFQRYFRDHQPPLLAAWGRNDRIFVPAGAEAFRRDLPDAEIRFLDTGHFALESHAGEMAALIRDFLDRRVGR
ncbi:alpha/beta fold hydrolase [Rhizosaccharibacter radicis]|uniref:Alpha/beta hydrolase n=1 Tax=Rhizosaccharibacter radicis TaxID=2782605 RepID=A0ABT1W040_9PROT|nr:alpha/beta hydrolase [Acetobacteraceae bacterium KSS12]